MGHLYAPRMLRATVSAVLISLTLASVAPARAAVSIDSNGGIIDIADAVPPKSDTPVDPIGTPKGINITAIGITNYTQLPGRALLDLPASNSLSTLSKSGITATPSVSLTSGAFVSWPVAGANDPGSGGGYIARQNSGIPISSITYTFSSPLAAVGATFMHFQPSRASGEDAPALIEAFDSAMNLIGTVTSSGSLSTTAGTPDFVAVWSNQLNIKYARISGTGDVEGFAVDAYGGSLTPYTGPLTSVEVPEPAGAILLAIAALSLARRRKQASA